jgi:flavorubredoxin
MEFERSEAVLIPGRSFGVVGSFGWASQATPFVVQLISTTINDFHPYF